MAVTGVAITGPVEGDDYDIERTVTGVPAGQTIAEAWLTIKNSPDDLDNAAVAQKIITTAPQAGVGQITDDGADGTGTLLFQLTPTDTRAIFAASTQPPVYDVQIRISPGNKIYTLEKGTIAVIQEVTLDS